MHKDACMVYIATIPNLNFTDNQSVYTRVGMQDCTHRGNKNTSTEGENIVHGCTVPGTAGSKLGPCTEIEHYNSCEITSLDIQQSFMYRPSGLSEPVVYKI